MNKSSLFITLVAVFLASSGWAQETDPVQIISDHWAAEQAQRAKDQARLEGLMDTVAAEMTRIRATENRTERDALMATHRQHMREAMALMRGMGGAHLREVMAEHTGSGMDPGMKMDRQQGMLKPMVPSRPRMEMSDAQRLTDLENRLDMMQVMMESVMESGTH